MFYWEVTVESFYQVSIGGITLRLVELQAKDGQAQKFRAKKLGGNWQDSNKILYHSGLLYSSEIIINELITRHHDDPLANHFSIKKMQKLFTREYYWKTLRHNIVVYVKGCDICSISKAVKY